VTLAFAVYRYERDSVDIVDEKLLELCINPRNMETIDWCEPVNNVGEYGSDFDNGFENIDEPELFE